MSSIAERILAAVRAQRAGYAGNLAKMNPNHDAQGRFAGVGGGDATFVHTHEGAGDKGGNLTHTHGTIGAKTAEHWKQYHQGDDKRRTDRHAADHSGLGYAPQARAHMDWYHDSRPYAEHSALHAAGEQPGPPTTAQWLHDQRNPGSPRPRDNADTQGWSR